MMEFYEWACRSAFLDWLESQVPLIEPIGMEG
jgi:hypothetical protein